MMDVNVFINKLHVDTGYKVEHARIKEPDLTEFVDLPVIYVGYATIDSKNPTSPIEHSFFNLHGEDLVQGFDVQIVCDIDSLATIWKNCYTSLIGFNPIPGEEYRSGFTYSQGGMIGISNGRIWWLDRWKIGFPTVFVQF